MRRRNLLGGAKCTLELSETYITLDASNQTYQLAIFCDSDIMTDVNTKAAITIDGTVCYNYSIGSNGYINLYINSNADKQNGRDGYILITYENQVFECTIYQTEDTVRTKRVSNTVTSSTEDASYSLQIPSLAYSSTTIFTYFRKTVTTYKYGIRKTYDVYYSGDEELVKTEENVSMGSSNSSYDLRPSESVRAQDFWGMSAGSTRTILYDYIEYNATVTITRLSGTPMGSYTAVFNGSTVITNKTFNIWDANDFD